MTEQYKHKFAAIILAAGKGTRMRSGTPKVLHEIAGRSMIGHVLAALSPLKPEKTVAVVAPEMDDVRKEVLTHDARCQFAVQRKQNGTGDAVRVAEDTLGQYSGTVLVLYGDTPLVTTDTLSRLLETAQTASLVVLGMRPDDSTGYGRLIVDASGQLEEIIEYRDASPEQRQYALCNSGVMAIDGKYLFAMVKKLAPHNAAGEYYLTDIAAIADDMKLRARVLEADMAELMGINSRPQLAVAEKALQQRLRTRAMEQGATLIDPDTVHLSADTVIGKDVTIYPQVVCLPKVVIEEGVEIRSFSHLDGAHVKKNAVVGPFARLRPGAVIGEEAHVGNFVEVKKATLGKGAKANHLSYIGDATVGEKSNIGAGTITCNYDGVNKHQTSIGNNVFIGSNSSLVAPVTIGDNAVVGAGSVITEDVPAESLALERGQQLIKQRKQKN